MGLQIVELQTENAGKSSIVSVCMCCKNFLKKVSLYVHVDREAVRIVQHIEYLATGGLRKAPG
jgi:hypothetical protein